MSTPIDLYYLPMSPPCRAVLMAARALGVSLTLKLTRLILGEHMTPHFLQMNPQHTIPTIDDNGFYLYESRAILQYLANSYGSNDKFYPKDPKKRALIDSRLQFDQGSLYKAFGDAYYVLLFQKRRMDPEKVEAFNTCLGFLESFLDETKYIAGDEMSIADFSIMASLSSAEACGHDFSKFTRITNYMETCKNEIDGYDELNQEGANQFGQFAKSPRKQN